MKKLFAAATLLALREPVTDITESQGPLWQEMKNQYQPFDLLFGMPNDPRVVVALAIKGFMSLLGILFLCYIIYAGVTWMTAGGEEEKIRKAKSTLISGTIGMIIIFAAFTITAFIVLAFGCATSTTGHWCLFFNNLTW